MTASHDSNDPEKGTTSSEKSDLVCLQNPPNHRICGMNLLSRFIVLRVFDAFKMEAILEGLD